MPKPDPTEPLSVNNIAMSLLKTQNLSLANKITSLKRENSDLARHKHEYEQKNLALETNFSLFKQHWNKHLMELKALRQLQKPFNDKKLEQEMEECFGVTFTALDSLVFQQSQEEFQEKVVQMFKTLGKFHKDIITGSQRVIESAVERLTQDIEQNRVSTEEGLSNLNAFQQKLQELSNSIEMIHETNMKVEKNPFITELNEMKKKVEQLEEDIADLKEYNEVLNRRYKVALKGFTQIDEDIEKEKECKFNNNVNDQIANKEVEEDEEEEKKHSDGSSMANKDIALLTQKIERFEKDIQELMDEKLSLLAQNEKLKQEKKNMDEVFFNSKLYNSLISQAQELLKYINLLKSKINQYEKLMKDFEKSRTGELEEVFKKIVEDKDKYLSMIKDISISYDNERKKFDQVESELVKEYDLAVKFSSFMQIMEQNDKKYSNLNQENELLRNQVKEYNERVNESGTQISELKDKVANLNAQNLKLKSMIPGEIKWEEVPFRHSKHKEFLAELHNLNKKHNLNIKEKVDDLKVYIKSREEKVEHMESKIKHLNNEIAQSKKQAEQLIKEVELNSRIAGDIDQKYQQLNSQIRSQNENFANLVKEKVNDRTLFQQEKAALQGRIKADGELIEKLQNHVNDLNVKIQALNEIKETQDEYISIQKLAIEENKTIRESLLKKIEEQKMEISTMKESYEILEQSNKDFIKENENLKKSVKEKSGYISQKLQRLKKMSNDATITDEEEIEFLKLENEKFKRMITCSVCGLKEKSVVLAKCFHTFCRPCISGTMEARNRRCPVCKTKIGLDDIKTIHWDV